MKCPNCGGEERYKNGRCAPCTRACNQRWKENNRERHRAGSARWAKDNKATVRRLSRESGRRRRGKVAATQKAWRERFPEKHVAQEQKRRARKAGTGGTYTSAEWTALCAFFGNRCLRCGRSDAALSVDHVIPVSSGGMNTIDNLQPLCGPCNSTKGTQATDYRIDWMTGEELSQAIPPAYTRWIGERLMAVLQREQVAS